MPRIEIANGFKKEPFDLFSLEMETIFMQKQKKKRQNIHKNLNGFDFGVCKIVNLDRDNSAHSRLSILIILLSHHQTKTGMTTTHFFFSVAAGYRTHNAARIEAAQKRINLDSYSEHLRY